MMKLLPIFMVILLSLDPAILERYFMSSADLELLLQTEEKVIKSMQVFTKTEKKRLNYLDKYLARLKTEYELAMKDIPHYFGNPINAYTIIKRLGPDLVFAEDILRNKTNLNVPDAIFPTQEDLSDSVFGLVSILSTYNIDIIQLSNGILNFTDSQNNKVYAEIVSPMTASDCHSIGKTLYDAKLYKDAIPWLEQAYKKIDYKHCDVCLISPITVIDLICQAYYELGDKDNFIEWTEKRIILLPDDEESLNQISYINALRDKNIVNEKRKEKGKKLNVTMTSGTEFDICYNMTKINKQSARLSCYYAHGPHPVLTVAPLKAERLHRDPDLTMFYEVLSDQDIETIKMLSKPKLWNSTYSGKVDYRNAECVVLDDGCSEVIARASRRAMQLSGLSSRECEPLKVINYGIGGYYHEHLDTRPFHSKKSITDWDRIGTVLFYLSDQKHGGTTVFPLLDLAVIPKKGAALFCMNILPSAVSDWLLLHAACPVLHGEKWVAVKWPHQYPNKDWCPVWITEKGIVNEKLQKNILKYRKYKYNKRMAMHERFNHDRLLI